MKSLEQMTPEEQSQWEASVGWVEPNLDAKNWRPYSGINYVGASEERERSRGCPIDDGYRDLPKAQKRWRARAEQRGRCTHCSQQSLPERRVCQVHLEQERIKNRAGYAKRKLAGYYRWGKAWKRQDRALRIMIENGWLVHAPGNTVALGPTEWTRRAHRLAAIAVL